MATAYYDSIRQAREKADLTQEQVAADLGVSRQAVAKWENGAGNPPTLSRLIQLSDLYKTSLDKLVGRA